MRGAAVTRRVVLLELATWAPVLFMAFLAFVMLVLAFLLDRDPKVAVDGTARVEVSDGITAICRRVTVDGLPCLACYSQGRLASVDCDWGKP